MTIKIYSWLAMQTKESLPPIHQKENQKQMDYKWELKFQNQTRKIFVPYAPKYAASIYAICWTTRKTENF